MTIDQKAQAAMRRIEALLNTKGCTEAEAEARIAKAQELLEAYGLDMAQIGGTPQKRDDKVKRGGLYSWQRNLWKAVAELNFCYYFSIKGLERGSTYQHRLVGSPANVIATEKMASYLQETIERLAQRWAKDNFYKSVFVREAIAYREGMADRIAGKLQRRRDEIVSEERRKAEERKKEQARDASASSSTALTILDVISSEADFNNDYLQGWEMGTTARNRAEQEARHAAWWRDYQERMRKRDEEEAANPALKEERLRRERQQAAKWAEEDAKRQRRVNRTPPKPRQRKETAEEKRRGLRSFWEGYDAGDKVGLDTQVDAAKRRAIR